MDEFETEQMHYEIDALRAENERLRERLQVDIGGSDRIDELELALAITREENDLLRGERATVVAYLRANTCGCHDFAGDIERGEHREQKTP